MRNTIIESPKKIFNVPIPYLGLKLTIPVIKSQIYLVRQSL
jgi:hypothetical protein